MHSPGSSWKERLDGDGHGWRESGRKGGLAVSPNQFFCTQTLRRKKEPVAYFDTGSFGVLIPVRVFYFVECYS